jgi:hypothetical protein
MRAIQIVEETGPDTALRLVELDEPEPAERKPQVARVAQHHAHQRRWDAVCRGCDIEAESHGCAVTEPLRRERRRELDRLARIGDCARQADEGQREETRQPEAGPRCDLRS